MKSSLLRSTFAALVVASLAACSKSTPASSTAAGEARAPHQHKHEHVPPHGGTAVVLGQEAFHLELLLDAPAGKLSLYVMDGELENFVRIAAPSIEVVATVAGAPRTLVFQPVVNAATGEKIGDTALYEVSADWLKTTANFDAVLTAVTIRGVNFTGVAFNFPKGNDTD